MNELSGYVEIEMAGEVIPFKFGSNAWSLFCGKRKIEFYQIAESGIFGKIDNGEVTSGPDVFALQDIFYFAYVTAKRMKGLPTINFEQFISLLDETPGVMVKLQGTLLSSKVMGYTFTELAVEGEKANFPQSQ